jgi:hypothetical protein
MSELTEPKFKIKTAQFSFHHALSWSARGGGGRCFGAGIDLKDFGI